MAGQTLVPQQLILTSPHISRLSRPHPKTIHHIKQDVKLKYKKHDRMETILYNISSIHNIQQYNLKIKPKEECSSGKVPLEVSKYPCSDIQLYT